MPRRLSRYLPDLKLIYLVRDPLDRIESHHAEAVSGGYAECVDLDRLLKSSALADNHYVRTSKYFFQISAFLEHFDRRQMLIIDQAQLRSDRLSSLDEVFDFLGVKRLTDGSLFDFELNASSDKLKDRRLLQWMKSERLAFVRKRLPRGLKDAVRESALARKILRVPVPRPHLSQGMREILMRELEDDVRQLREHTGLPLSSWSV